MASSERWVSGFRIVAPPWLESAFSGEGAAKYGGRWNPPGVPMVYLASSRALAALEILVHLPNPLSRRKPYFLVEAQIPADSLRDASWAGDPASTGADWIHAESSLALRVPSVLVPEEPNYLLNPRHPDMREIRTGAPVGFTFDPRL